MGVLETLTERGFIKQITHEGLGELLNNESVTFYIGFDPTADSLHVGHFVALMAMAHMQKAGHTPICLVGGGTSMIGDPSGKTDMRKMMTKQTIAENSAAFRVQMSKFLDFSPGKAIMADNADWLTALNYVDFIRDIGSHFSVNRMLTAECYKRRMESGLTFLEFNYMIMQAYDFLVLNQKYGCKLQMGGDDQWSNILAGADLIRRKEQKEAYGLTCALLLKSDGNKMGKTEGGALWLDRNKTSPYEFYQYWRNVADADVSSCLALLTFLPMDEVRRLSALPGEQINEAKAILAFELTKMVHSEEDALSAKTAAEGLFSGGASNIGMPTLTLTTDEFEQSCEVIELLQKCKITASRGEGRRLIREGAISIDDIKITDEFAKAELKPETILKKGKKVYYKIIVE